MHFTFYLGDSGRLGLNLQFKSDVKSGLKQTHFQCPEWMTALTTLVKQNM